jgi:hypothetical protein
MPVPAETIKTGVKLEAIEGSQAVQKCTNSRRRLLYRLLGGGLVLGPITHYKIPERTGEIPCVIGGDSQLLVESPRPLGLDKQACRTLLYNYLP